MADFSFLMTNPALPGSTSNILYGSDKIGTGWTDDGSTVNVTFDPEIDPALKSQILAGPSDRIVAHYEHDDTGQGHGIDGVIDFYFR